MRFMLHHPARCVVVMLVSFSMLSVGCQSTRNGLAKVPGMNWLATDDADSFPGWESDAPQVEFPPPSQDAIPVVASEGLGNISEERVASTDVNPAVGDYPSTGYPSPYGEDSTATVRADRDITPVESPEERVSRATVGETQKGFYSEDYPAEQTEELVDPGLASQPAVDPYGYDSQDSYSDYQDNYDNTYAEPYDVTNANDTVVADANPEFEDLGQPVYDPSTESLEPPMEDFQAGSSGYGTDAQWQDEVGGQLRQGAEAMSQKAGEIGEFTRDQIDSFRDSVGDGVDQLSGAARETYTGAVDGATAAIEGAADMFGDTSTKDQQDNHVNTLPPQDVDPSAEAPPAEDPGYAEANTYQPETQLTGGGFPEAQPTFDNGTPTGEPQYSRPRRTAQPWRPGSTGSLGPARQDQTGVMNQDPRVAPASYPNTGSESLQPSRQYPATEPSSYPSTGAGQYPETGASAYPSTGAEAYPDSGWESGANTGRLSPNYR